MRIVCWNCNGLRTLRQYKPWYNLKDWKECLDYLEADMICFQEAKVTKKDLIVQCRDMCLPSGYEAYYSLHPTKGYSGVATFIKTDVCLPLKAEIGLTGEMVPDRRDSIKCIGGYPDEKAVDSPLYDVIDAEGRAVVVDCGLFVLFNLYCPNETDETRRDYKMAYSYTLAERVKNLISKGREVVIVGDLNIAHLPIDHCKNVSRLTRDDHLDEHPARRWLDRFLAPNGDFHDVTRDYHPGRKAMYTCWDTIKDTRPANYGARIDYTLVTKGLLPWIKFADIQANIYGSDHCPIYVDFHDEITSKDGSTLRLQDHLKPSITEGKRKVPTLATSCWPEFSGRRLQSFFSAKASSGPHPVTSMSEVENVAQNSPAAADPPSMTELLPTALAPIIHSAEKRKFSVSETASPIKKANTAKKASPIKASPGQMKLNAFFARPKVAESQDVEEETETSLTPSLLAESITSPSSNQIVEGVKEEEDEDEDPSEGASRVESALAWGSIFAPKEPPLCSFHREPARAWTVNKAGPNHGRKFWMCSRKVGGTNESSNPGEFRCEYWKWDSDIRTKAKKQDREADGSLKSFHEVAGRAPHLASGEKRQESRQQVAQRPPHKSAFRREKK